MTHIAGLKLISIVALAGLRVRVYGECEERLPEERRGLKGIYFVIDCDRGLHND